MAKVTVFSLFSAGWRSVREAGGRRLLLTAAMLLAALVLARFSYFLPFTVNAENALYDARVYETAEQVEQDRRVVMVVYTDDTLIAARKRSPLDRGLLAAALKQIDTMNAKAIGIDIFFDQPQDEDEELIAALSAMQTPVSVAYAEEATNENNINYNQEQFLRDFLARLDGTKVQPASVRLVEALGVTRIWPGIVPNLPPLLGRSMLNAGGDGALTMPDYAGAVRYRLPALAEYPIYSQIDIGVLANPDLMAIPEVADPIREQVQGNYVLIGGSLADIDRVLTPLTSVTGETIPGLEWHAISISQMLDGAALPRPASWLLWLQALIVIVAAALTGLLEIRTWKLVPILIVQMIAIIGLPILLQMRGFDTSQYPSVGPVLGWLVAFIAVVSAARASGAVQRKFAQGALGKYLPASIAQEIIDKPELLALHGEKKAIFVIFSDLEGFTKMSHALEPEMVATLLNRYLEMLSKVVLDHGGVIDKFVGDAVVAFWGAPIAREDDGTRAAQAGYAMWQAGEAFRAEVAAMDANLPLIGKTRVGMHYGEAVIGNFGGANRIQYTALGDSMNTSARLEAANKALESSTMASAEFADRSGLDWWRPMGRVVLRGRAKPVDLREPAPDFPAPQRKALEQAISLLDQDHAKAISMLTEIAASNPADKALKNLLKRCQKLNGDGAYVLG